MDARTLLRIRPPNCSCSASNAAAWLFSVCSHVKGPRKTTRHSRAASRARSKGTPLRLDSSIIDGCCEGGGDAKHLPILAVASACRASGTAPTHRKAHVCVSQLVAVDGLGPRYDVNPTLGGVKIVPGQPLPSHLLVNHHVPRFLAPGGEVTEVARDDGRRDAVGDARHGFPNRTASHEAMPGGPCHEAKPGIDRLSLSHLCTPSAPMRTSYSKVTSLGGSLGGVAAAATNSVRSVAREASPSSSSSLSDTADASEPARECRREGWRGEDPKGPASDAAADRALLGPA